MTNLRLIVGCPWCDHEYSEEDSQEMIEGRNDHKCCVCGRRFRLYTEEEVVRVSTGKYCVLGACDWQPTVSPDFEKCCQCFDIRKTPVSVPA